MPGQRLPVGHLPPTQHPPNGPDPGGWKLNHDGKHSFCAKVKNLKLDNLSLFRILFKMVGGHQWTSIPLFKSFGFEDDFSREINGTLLPLSAHLTLTEEKNERALLVALHLFRVQKSW